MALIVHPRCNMGVWRPAEEGWDLWVPDGDRLKFVAAVSTKPTQCYCGYPLVERADGSLEPLRSR